MKPIAWLAGLFLSLSLVLSGEATQQLLLVGTPVAATATAAWSPANLTNIVAWWRSDSGVSPATDSTAVDSWTDSIIGVAASATSTARPTFYTNILNSYPVVRYGSTSKLLTASIAPLVAGTNYMLGMVYKLTTPATAYFYHQGPSAAPLVFGETTSKSAVQFKLTSVVETYAIGVATNLFNLVLFTRSGDTCRHYVNGYLTAQTSGQGATAPSTSSNILGLFCNQAGSFPLRGDVSDMFVANSYSTGAVDQLWNYYSNKYSLLHTSTYVVFDGNSLTHSLNSLVASYPAKTLESLGIPNYEGANLGIIGQTTAQMEATAAAKVDPLYLTNKSIYIAWEGINSIDASVSAADTELSMSNLCWGRKNLGFKVIVMTTLPWTNVSAGAVEPIRKDFNNLIRSNYAKYANVLCDVATNASLCPTGEQYDCTNTAFYAADKVHLVAAGYAAVALSVSNSVREVSWP